MKQVFFLLNDLEEFDFQPLLRKYLTGVQVAVGDAMPATPSDYDLIVLWSYRKILKDLPSPSNVILFHSSNLPDGRGWAPIYYSLSSGAEYFTISGLLASPEVDAGDLLVKARFRIRDHYTAEYLRRWDSEISIILVRELLARFDQRLLVGTKQTGQGSYYRRRRPEENEVALNLPLDTLMAHLRACEHRHPAYFFWRDVKYYLYIEPSIQAEFPSDLEIAFLDSGEEHYHPYAVMEGK